MALTRRPRKIAPSASKIMGTVFLAEKNPIRVKPFPTRTTATCHHYTATRRIRNASRVLVRPTRKTPERLHLHDICKAHTNMRAAEGTTEFGWTVLAPLPLSQPT
jgi:hypothetical protein